jgi:rRNA maturation protein Nop10
MRFGFLPCHECGELMTGIKDYKAREVCEECGGKALIANPSREEDVKTYPNGKKYKEMIIQDKKPKKEQFDY